MTPENFEISTPKLKVWYSTAELRGQFELISLCYLAQNITNLNLIIKVCEPHLSVRWVSNPLPFAYQANALPIELLTELVGIAGVEPAASWSQTKRLTPRLYPEFLFAENKGIEPSPVLPGTS